MKYFSDTEHCLEWHGIIFIKLYKEVELPASWVHLGIQFMFVLDYWISKQRICQKTDFRYFYENILFHIIQKLFHVVQKWFHINWKEIILLTDKRCSLATLCGAGQQGMEARWGVSIKIADVVVTSRVQYRQSIEIADGLQTQLWWVGCRTDSVNLVHKAAWRIWTGMCTRLMEPA